MDFIDLAEGVDRIVNMVNSVNNVTHALKAAGWGVVEGSRILREYHISPGRIEGRGRRGAGEAYAKKLEIRFTFATNDQVIYGVDMETGKEAAVSKYPTPDELWAITFAKQNRWRDYDECHCGGANDEGNCTCGISRTTRSRFPPF